MYSTEQKILWLCIGIVILSFISAKILYTQFGKESLLKMPSSYHYKNLRCKETKPNIFGKCLGGRKLCPNKQTCVPKNCECPLLCTRTQADSLRMCKQGEKLCPDLKTCVPKDCNC